jgi:3'(2'), 5'-bisphosphate nucleotidase
MEILRHYDQSGPVETKADNSPLTQADRASHELLTRGLHELTPDIPILSEEGKTVDPTLRQSWSRFWLIDPLDGTKEFIKKTGEFTVNIALIEAGRPTLGLVYAPVLHLLYWSEKNEGAWKKNGEDHPQRVRTRPARPETLTIVASRDHAGPEVQNLLQRYPTATSRSMGSSLKFCLVAEGSADIYLRDVPTMEWDTGAAQAIVEAAGGQVLTTAGKLLTYNKDSLINPAIVTLGSNADWLKW